MDNKLIAISITLVLGVILVGSLLVPLIQDADDGQKYTYINPGYRASEVNSDMSYTWDATNGITLSDSTKIPSNATDGSLVVFACDTGFAKTNYAGTILNYYGFNQSTYIAGNNITSLTVSIDYETKTINLSNIVSSVSIADQALSYNEWCYVPSTNGESIIYAPIVAAKDFYIESESSIKGFFYSGNAWALSLSNTSLVSHIGTVDYSVNLTESDTDYDNLKKIVGIQSSPNGNYSVTVSGAEYYSAFIVLDRDATGITDVGRSISGVLWAIPVMVLLALLVFAVRGVFKD